MNKLILTLALSAVLFFGCTAQKGTLFTQGSEFVYAVDSTGNKNADTILLSIPVTHSFFRRLFISQRDMKWTYVKSGTKESTGYIDNKTEASIHPPRKAYMEFTEIPPFPEANLPLAIGNSSKIEMHVQAGFGKLDGMIINQVLKVVEKKEIQFLGQQISVWVLKGENTDHLDDLGKYEVTFYFNEEYGFVRMEYVKPNGHEVNLQLVKVTRNKE